MKDKLRELADDWCVQADAHDEIGFGAAADVGRVCANELLDILDAEGDGGAAKIGALVTRNPAPNAAAAMVPSSPTVTLHVGASTHPARSGVVSDEDERDARRYRYLRSANADDDVPYVAMQKTNDWGKTAACWLQEDEADKAIDAAIQGERHER